MINLYWRTEGQTRSLIPKPFSTEAEFEKYEFENQDLLYNAGFREILIRPKNPDSVDISELEPLFIAAFKQISGTP